MPLSQREVPHEERWEQIPDPCWFPTPLPPPQTKGTLHPDAVSSGGLPPFPSSPPRPPPCRLSRVADGWRWLWHLGRATAGSPQVWCCPSTGATVGSMCGGSHQGQGRQAGKDRASLLLPWLLGMFLSRNNSLPRHPVLVFSSVSAIKISGPGRCEMNFGGVLKPWL